MKKGAYLPAILRSPKTVFTVNDVSLLWHERNSNAVRVRLNYYVEQGFLYRLRKGIYAKSNQYEKLELGTRIFTPSYISFETVLAKEGIIFQYQSAVTVATYLTREVTVEDTVYSFRKLKDSVLLQPLGIEFSNETSIATKERAFLDTLYLHSDFYFDNTRSLDWDKVMSILPIYQNKRLNKVVEKLRL